MRRRTVLSTLVAITAGGAGCLQTFRKQSNVQIDIPVCNFAAEPQSGEITGTRLEDGNTVLADSFDFSGVREGNTTTAPDCTVYSEVLTQKGTYQFSIDLESGISEVSEWNADENHGLQIELYSQDIRFKELESASP